VQRNTRPGTGLSSPTQGSGTGPDPPKDECANPWAGWMGNERHPRRVPRGDYFTRQVARRRISVPIAAFCGLPGSWHNERDEKN